MMKSVVQLPGVLVRCLVPICHPWVPGPRLKMRPGRAARDTWRAGHRGGRHVWGARVLRGPGHSELRASWQIFSWGVIAEQRSRDIKVTCSVSTGIQSHVSTQSEPQPTTPANLQLISMEKQNKTMQFSFCFVNEKQSKFSSQRFQFVWSLTGPGNLSTIHQQF